MTIHSSTGNAALRPEIASAWRRAELCGLDPGSGVAEADVTDVDRQSRLMVAAAPVLDGVERQLSDTRYSLLLADRDARIVDRRLGLVQLGRALDAVLAVPGHRYGEETTGTNALASPFETRGRITVHGHEHFLDQLKGFTCHGSPIRHPVSGRLEGVLDITGTAADANPLLGTVADLAAREIEKRLVSNVGLNHQAMLHAFQVGTSRSRAPIVVFGDDLTLINDAASDLLDTAGRTALRDLAEHAAARGGGRGLLRLLAGTEVAFVCRGVDGAQHATFVELVCNPTPRPVASRGQAEKPPAVGEHGRILISGEPGTGRTRAAIGAAGEGPVLRLDPDSLPSDASTLAAHMKSHRGPILMEHLHLLDERTSARFGEAIDLCPQSRIIATTVPGGDEAGVRSLIARFERTIHLQPLRLRRADIPELARRILTEAAPRSTPRLTTSALHALMRWPWPGNLVELSTVLRAAAARHPGRDLSPGDLGLDHMTRRQRVLTPLEEVEAEAIQAALRRAHGNKTRAAAELGISRTTIHRRIVEFGIDS